MEPRTEPQAPAQGEHLSSLMETTPQTPDRTPIVTPGAAGTERPEGRAARQRLRALLQQRRELSARPPGLRALDALLARVGGSSGRAAEFMTSTASLAVCVAGPTLLHLRGPLRRLRGAIEDLTSAGRLRVMALGGAALGVDRVVRALPEYGGDFELDLRSHVSRPLLLGRFERALLPLLHAALDGQAGDAIDIGANVGVYSVLCGRLLQPRGGRVLVVEPAPTVLPLLRANLARSGLANVDLFPGALAATAGSASLYYSSGNEEYAALGPPSHPRAPAQLLCAPVVTDTLDALVERFALRPHFIKMDTEGAEAQVLAGGAHTLVEHRPVLLSELDDRLLGPRGGAARGVLAVLESAGYAVHDAFSGARLRPAAVAPGFIGEILALPEEA